jgi:hypothetical protein
MGATIDLILLRPLLVGQFDRNIAQNPGDASQPIVRTGVHHLES